MQVIKKEFNSKIIQIIDEIEDIKTFKLIKPKDFNFICGQYCMLAFTDKKIYRPFSIASSPTDNFLEFTIKKIGKFTNEMFNMKIGQELIIEGPFGKDIIFDNNKKDIVCLAGGSGIIPFRGMIKYKHSKNLIVIHSNKTKDDILYYLELANLNIIHTLTKEVWGGENGRIDYDMIKRYIKKPKDCIYYICGNQSFVESLTKILLEKNILEKNIKKEMWGKQIEKTNKPIIGPKNYLGIDCGSVSVKMVVLNESKKIIAKTYLPNQGLKDTVINSIKLILKQLKNQKICAVGITGSGRRFVKALMNADIIKTEILAHVTATQFEYPNVRTVIDIGGEDAKLIILNERGIWSDYILNNICGGGTGSTIVNIANNLNIKIEQVANLALKSKEKLNFPGKCGVLLNSAVITAKNHGTRKEDILMGVCRAVVKNYMLLAKNKSISKPFVFQGATAKNQALIKAFEEELKTKINIPKYPELMGALGMAIICKNEKINNEFIFNENQIYDIKLIKGTNCPNECDITIMYKRGKKIESSGNRCHQCVSEY